MIINQTQNEEKIIPYATLELVQQGIEKAKLDINKPMSIAEYGTDTLDIYETLAKELSQNIDSNTGVGDSQVIEKIQKLLKVLKLEELSQALVSEDGKKVSRLFNKALREKEKIIKETSHIASKMEALRMDFIKWSEYTENINRNLSTLSDSFKDMLDKLDDYKALGRQILVFWEELEGHASLAIYFNQRVESLEVTKASIDQSIRIINTSLTSNLNTYTKLQEVYKVVLPGLETAIAMLKSNIDLQEIQATLSFVITSTSEITTQLIKTSNKLALKTIKNIGYDDVFMEKIGLNNTVLIEGKKEINREMKAKSEAAGAILDKYEYLQIENGTEVEAEESISLDGKKVEVTE
jgi:macrodomain Ter protein organizer (MatP/YcbG family)